MSEAVAGLMVSGVDEVKAATGAGALAAGVPIITDLDLPEVKVPGVCAHEECLVKEPDHKKIVQKAIEARGIKIKVAKVPIPVLFSAAFEGERVRKADMYVQFGGKYSPAFEYLNMKKSDEVEDGKIEVIGLEINSMKEGESVPYEYGAIVDKVQVRIYTKESDVKKLLPKAGLKGSCGCLKNLKRYWQTGLRSDA